MRSFQNNHLLFFLTLFFLCAGALLGGFSGMVFGLLSAAALTFILVWVLGSASPQPCLVRVRSESPRNLRRPDYRC